MAEVFYQHSLQAAHDSGFPVLEVTDAQQRGRQFGARLANAFADAFAQGYKHVIAVGSDCPHLHEVDWRAVEERLEKGTPVLGPTPDHGGTYLIGLSRAQFSRQAFAALPWQSPRLLASLTRYLADHADVAPALLTPRSDVNGVRDLMALVRGDVSLPDGIVAQLRLVLGPLSHAAHSETLTSDRPVRGFRLRAPPSWRPVSRM